MRSRWSNTRHKPEIHEKTIGRSTSLSSTRTSRKKPEVEHKPLVHENPAVEEHKPVVHEKPAVEEHKPVVHEKPAVEEHKPEVER